MIVNPLRQNKVQKGNTLFVALLSTTLFLTGCAGTSKSKASFKLVTVQTALATAKENNALEHAPVALNEAEEKLRSAQAAIAKDKDDEADALLEEALLTAKYAEAKAEATTAKERVVQLKEMIGTLRHEMLLSR